MAIGYEWRYNDAMIHNSDSPLRVAVWGVGGQGGAHLKALRAIPEVRVVALCDINPSALKTASEAFSDNPILSTEPEQLAREVECDYAVVIVPNPARMGLLEILLSRRIPVFMEKPATHTLADLDALIQWQSDAAVPVMVGHNYRFTPEARLIRRLINEGAIGPILDVHGFFKRNHALAEQAYYGRLPGPLPLRIEMMIHHLDLAQSWIGAPLVKTVADGWRNTLSWGVGETASNVLALYENQVRFNYHGDWAAPANLTSFYGHWIITGETGSLRWADGPIQLYRKHATRYTWDAGESQVFTPAGGDNDSFLFEHREWVDALRTGRAPQSSLQEAAQSLRLCLLAAEQHALA